MLIYMKSMTIHLCMHHRYYRSKTETCRVHITSSMQILEDMSHATTGQPMPTEIIETVHRLAAACKIHTGIIFTDRNGKIINDRKNNNDKNDDNI